MTKTVAAVLWITSTLTAHATELGGEITLIQGGIRKWSLLGNFEAAATTDVGAAFSLTEYPGDDRGNSAKVWLLTDLSRTSKLRVSLGSTKSPDLVRTIDLGVRGSFELSTQWTLSAGLDRAISADAPALTLSGGLSYSPHADWIFGLDFSSTRLPLNARLTSRKGAKKSRALLASETGTASTDLGLWATYTVQEQTTLGASLFFSKVTLPAKESIQEIGINADHELSSAWLIGTTLARSSSSLLSHLEWVVTLSATYRFPSAENSSSD